MLADPQFNLVKLDDFSFPNLLILQFYEIFMVQLYKLLTDIFLNSCRTLTTPVSLIQCLKSIKEYAFVKSHYPLIITLEDHLTPDLQARVAEVMFHCYHTHKKNILQVPIFVGIECKFNLICR